MFLNAELKRQYADRGYCVLPNVLSDNALEALRLASDACSLDTSDPGRVTEEDGSTVRGLHGAHLRNDALSKLCRHPVLLDAAKQILAQEVYVHQFKLNIKAAFVGDVWEWHQDMTFYHREDEIPEPAFLTIAVFLDDVTEFNGPLTHPRLPSRRLQGQHQAHDRQLRQTKRMAEQYDGEAALYGRSCGLAQARRAVWLGRAQG